MMFTFELQKKKQRKIIRDAEKFIERIRKAIDKITKR